MQISTLELIPGDLVILPLGEEGMLINNNEHPNIHFAVILCTVERITRIGRTHRFFNVKYLTSNGVVTNSYCYENYMFKVLRN